MIDVVIDADVAKSSGTTNHPISSSCRKLLDVVKDNGHSAVYCKKLKEEWDKHQSNYFQEWLVLMLTKDKLKRIKHDDGIKKLINDSNVIESIRGVALKDSHLIDIAIATGKSIASNDDNAKNAFLKIPDIHKDIKNICWINPVFHKDELVKIFYKDACNISNAYKPFL